MQNKQSLAIAVVALAVLCVTGSASHGQYQPRWVAQSASPSGPPSLPDYVASNVDVAQLVSPGSPGLGRSTEPAFRITVVQDGNRARQAAYSPQDVQAPPPIQPQVEPNAGVAPPMQSDWGQSDCYGACQTDCGKGCAVDYDVKGCGCKGECTCNCYAVRVYGEYLLLRARDAEVAYAVEANSNEYQMLGPEYPIQISPIGVLDQDYSSGFRFGFGICLSECSELAATYTWFDSATSDTLVRGTFPIPNVVPVTAHPATLDNLSTTVAAVGRHDIGFEMIDLDYRRTFYQTPWSEMTYVVGARWGQLEQSFGARYTDDPVQPLDELGVNTDIDFNGGGIRLGLEGERSHCFGRFPVLVYAKGLTSLLAGEFSADYSQIENNNVVKVDTAWSAGRIVPTFDFEVGTGVATPKGGLRMTIGYVYSAWTNVVKTEDWIRAVQTNNVKDLGDTMTFDGLVGRIEARF
jgi:hypothetical protein